MVCSFFWFHRRVSQEVPKCCYVIGEHVSYWNRIPGNYEHWRFSQGYDDGWRTNYAFLAFECATPNGQVAELGFARSWASSNRSHRGDFFWEYGERRDLREEKQS